MKQKLTYINNLAALYEVLGSIILSLCISLTFNDILTISPYHVLFVLFSTILVFFFRFMIDNRTKIMAYFVLLAILILSFVFLSLIAFPSDHLFQNLWSYALGSYTGDFQSDYAILFTFILSFFISLLSYILYHIERIRLILSLPFLGLMIIFPLYKMDLSKLTLFFILLYLFLSLASLAQRYDKNPSLEKIKLSIYLFPFCLFMTLALIFIPTKTEPIQWKFVFTVIEKTTDFANSILTQVKFGFGENTSYNLSFTGYSENGEISAGVIPSNKIQLHIHGKKAPQDVYLIGTVYDTYTGSGWKNTSTDSFDYPDFKVDTYELLQALYQSDLSIEKQKELVTILDAELLYQDIQTKSVFYPQKTLSLDLYGLYKNNYPGVNVVFPRFYLMDITYKTKYLTIDYNDPLLEDLYRTVDDAFYDVSTSDVIEYSADTFGNEFAIESLLLVDDMSSILASRAEDIRETYTRLPESLPSEVEDLARSITDAYDNPYDKTKAIEAYLNEIPYTYIPGSPEEGEDYVSYFLFEAESGYCTYFASSMAVLLRSIDIPTRYVEGFVVNYDSRLTSLNYAIPASSAHAWCEVYFEGIGWIPFEPTGKYTETRYNDLKNSPAPNVNSTPEEDSSYGEDMMDQYLDETDILNEDSESFEIQKYEEALHFLLIIGLYVVLLLLLFFVCYYFILRLQRKRRYLDSNEKGKITLIVKQMILILELDHNIQIGLDSPSMMFEDLITYSSHLNLAWKSAKDIYLKQRHSPYLPCEADLELYHSICLELKKEYFKNTRSFQKLYFKMFQTIL